MTNQRRHTPKLRLLSAFLAAAMAMTTLPAAAFAESGIISDLSVAGKSVTSDNAADILGDGTAKYEGSVLTLNGEISVPQDKTGIQPLFSITIDGTGTLTGTEKTGYGILPQTDKATIASGADITLENFKHGSAGGGVDVSGTLTIRDVNYGVSGQGATVESSGRLVIQNADNAVSGGGAKVRGTLEIDEADIAVSDGGVKVYEGGVVTITGANTGLSGGSTVDGGSLSVSAETCIGNGEVTFTSGTLKLDSTNNKVIELDKLNVNAVDFWYRTAKDGAWTQVTGGSWTRPSDTAYFEITTEDPTVTHYTVTFDLNGGTSWEWVSDGKWNDSHDQVSFTTHTGDSGEGLSISVEIGMGPKREGYEFAGWYTAAGEPVEEQSYYTASLRLEPITEDITLYAHWQQNGEDVALNKTNFPDDVFLNYVKQFDTDSDGVLSADELDAVTKIDVYHKNIKDLTGIEYFPKLKRLDCGNNQLTDLDVSRNPALVSLNCSYNQIAQLDVSMNPMLDELVCTSNQITKLDLSKNSILWHLDCYGNQLTQLDLSCNTRLTELYGYSNQLTSLDLSQNSKLDYLDCTDCQLNIELDAFGQFDLSTLPGFDPSKATWPEGVTAAGSILTVPEGTENIIYEYDAGNGHTLWFCLTASRSEDPGPIIPDDPEAPDSSAGGAAAAIAVTALGGAAVWGGYELSTRIILNSLLPEGAAIPKTRGELALLLWQNAGSPEPAAQPAFADVTDAETAKAAQWCTEQGLLTAEDGAFRPEQRVTKYRVIQIWKQAAANAE